MRVLDPHKLMEIKSYYGNRKLLQYVPHRQERSIIKKKLQPYILTRKMQVRKYSQREQASSRVKQA